MFSNKSCHFISTIIANFSHQDQKPILIRKTTTTAIPIAYSSSSEFCPSKNVSNTHKENSKWGIYKSSAH